MNPTDQASLAALKALAHNGVVIISSRRLAEEIGRSRDTASRSLGRLIKGGYLEVVRTGRGLQSARYRVVSNPLKPAQNPDSNKTSFEGVRDLFRSQELYGAGRLI